MAEDKDKVIETYVEEKCSDEVKERIEYLKKIITLSSDNKRIYINFAELFDQDIEEYVNEFRIFKKRKYPEYSPQMVKELIYVSAHNPGVLYAYAELKSKIISEMVSDEKNYPRREFVQDVVDKILTSETIEVIKDLVDNTYTLKLDEAEVKEGDNVREELQITDGHNKGYLQTSIALRICIPILLEYTYYFTDKKPDDVVRNTLSLILDKIDDDLNLYNKIHKFVESRVKPTEYPEGKIWSKLEVETEIIELVIGFIITKVFVNIFPKVINNTSFVSFLSVVIDNQLRFFFKQPFEVIHKPLNMNIKDKDGLTQSDKLESMMIRFNEGNVILNRLVVNSEITKFINEVGISDITNSEFKYYSDNLEVNRIQQMLLNLFMSKRYGSFKIGYFADYNEYVLSVIALKTWLDQNGFPILAKYINGKPIKNIETKSVNRKKFLERLSESEMYQEILETKYKYSKDLIHNSGIINKIIGTLTSNTFKEVPFVEDYIEGDSNYDNVFEYPIENISIELLRFISVT